MTPRDARRDWRATFPYRLRAVAACALLGLWTGCGRSVLSDQPLGDGGPAVDARGPDGGFDAGPPRSCEVPVVDALNAPAVGRTPIAEGSTRDSSRVLSGVCGGQGPEVVVVWIPPRTGRVTFDTFGSTFDTVLYLADGPTPESGCEARTVPGPCSDDVDGAVFESALEVSVVEGEPVFMVVDSFGEGGDFVLAVDYGTTETRCSDRVDEDLDGLIDCDDPDCAGVAPCDGSSCRALSAGSDLGTGLIQSSTPGQGNEYAGGCGGANAPDEVVLWTAPFTGRYVIDTRGSSFDTVLYARLTEDGCTPSREVACNDDRTPDALDSVLTLELAAGTEIALVVDGYGLESGDYQLNIAGVAVPEVCDNGRDDNGDGQVDCDDIACRANPACAAGDCPLLTAETVGETTGSSVGHSNLFQSPCAAGPTPDLTFAWTAPHGGAFRFDTQGSTFDTVLTAYPDVAACDDPGLPPLACNDDTLDLWSALTLDVDAGQTLLFVVDGWEEGEEGDVVLRVTDLSPLPAEVTCDDGLDDDVDGLVDCDDPDCDADPDCQQPTQETRCANGLDDDADGLVDCDDPDCQGRPVCPTREVRCSDGLDDDRDGLVDCDDPDCQGRPACRPPTETRCDDLLDDDGDGDVDCDDDDCVDAPVCQPADCFDDDLGSATGVGVARGSTLSAGNDSGGSCGGTSAPEVMLRWTAPETATYKFDTFGSQYDTLIYLWRASAQCAALEIQDSCNDDARQSLQSLTTLAMTAGDSVYVVIDGYGTWGGNYNLNIRKVEQQQDIERDCFNGIDDDDDGQLDCFDSDCDASCSF